MNDIYRDDEGNLHCMEEAKGECGGNIEYRTPLSGTGRSFPRCDAHWTKRLTFQKDTNQRYPTLQPNNFDPMYAGERWDED